MVSVAIHGHVGPLTMLKKKSAKSRYMAACECLQVLASWLGKTGWDDVLHPLHDANMRYMMDMLDGQTEDTRHLSWIWKIPGVLGKKDDNLQDCKSDLYFNLASLM